MEKFQVGDFVQCKLTGDKAMVLAEIVGIGYLVRLPNYAEVALRYVEVKEVKNV